MKMKIKIKMNRRDLIKIIVLVLMSIGVVLCYFIYAGTKDRITRIEQELDSNKNTLAQLKQKQSDGVNYALETDKINAEIRAIESKLSHEKDIPDVLVNFYYLMLENGMDGSNISFSGIRDAGDGKEYRYMTVSFEVEDRKENIYNFLRNLDHYKKSTAIENIIFKAVNESVMKTGISMKMYLFKEDLQSDVNHNLSTDYDFMNGKYGKYKNWYEVFKQFAQKKKPVPGG